MGKSPIVNWKGMVDKIKETYLPKDYEVYFHRRRHNLKKKDVDVASYIKVSPRLCLKCQI